MHIFDCTTCAGAKVGSSGVCCISKNAKVTFSIGGCRKVVEQCPFFGFVDKLEE